MHNWERYVREHLPRLTVAPEREAEIISELALQLEQTYNSAVVRGESEEEAIDAARSQVRSWEVLARDINGAEHSVAFYRDQRASAGD